jgi:hypothetical protein
MPANRLPFLRGRNGSRVAGTCLVCLRAETTRDYVLCRACFHEHREVLNAIDSEPLSAVALRKKIWGQRFPKNRQPHIRATIAYGAYALAIQGDDELLAVVKERFQTGNENAHLEDPEIPGQELLAEVSALEKAIGRQVLPKANQPGHIRTKDGHFVRSQAERTIANYLFDNRIPYQYERGTNVAGKDVHPDFFLPDVGKEGIYIEHFGLLDNPRYKEVAERKAELMTRAGKILIATTQDELERQGEYAIYQKLCKYIPRLKEP